MLPFISNFSRSLFFVTKKQMLFIYCINLIVFLLIYYLSWEGLFCTSVLLGLQLSAFSMTFGLVGSLAGYVFLAIGVFIKTTLLWVVSLLTLKAHYSTLFFCGYLTNHYPLQASILLDFYSLSFASLTSCIGVFALLFTTNYMRNEVRISYFIFLLFFFLLSMLLLLTSSNLITLILGWELIGCFSFLLINFWVTRLGTFKSSFKAFFFNKLSDLSLLGVLLISIVLQPQVLITGFSNIFMLKSIYISIDNMSFSLLSCILFLLLLCAFCKSAQLGFHIWLPDSMEAPVPASALIHSATLVSAGIFLLGRFYIIFENHWISTFVLLWASLTSLYGGLVASYQTDLKKMLAYSTISHCGFLFILTIYNNLSGVILYLYLHGFFKSYSFFLAGDIISLHNGYQDQRRMSSNLHYSGINGLLLYFSLACLGGLPFLPGFFNKHLLLLISGEYYHYIISNFLYSAAFTGLFYTQKTLKSLSSGPFRGVISLHGLSINGITDKILTRTAPIQSFMLICYSCCILLFIPGYFILTGVYGSIQHNYCYPLNIHLTSGLMFFWYYLVAAFAYQRFSNSFCILIFLIVKVNYVLFLY